MTSRGEIELPRKSSPLDWDPDLVREGMALAHWLSEPSMGLCWQNFMEVFRLWNLPEMHPLGYKKIHEEVTYSSEALCYKRAQGSAEGSCWPLDIGASTHCRCLMLRKPLVHGRSWVLEKLQVLLAPEEPKHRNQEVKPIFFLCVCVRCFSGALYWQFNMMPVGIGKNFKGTISIFTKQAKRINLEQMWQDLKIQMMTARSAFSLFLSIAFLCVGFIFRWLSPCCSTTKSSARVLLLGIVTHYPMSSFVDFDSD